MKTRTALLIAVVGIGAFAAVEIVRRNGPAQIPSTSSPVRVAEYADPQAEVKAELTLPTDPTAKQRTIDAELNRVTKRALLDAQDDRKHRNDQ